MTTSAALAASAVVSTFSPAASALALLLLPAVQADHHVDAGIAQVQRVRVALAAVADDGDRLALQVARDFRLFRSSVLPYCS